MPWHLYFLEFPNGKRYIGFTANPRERRRAHGSTNKDTTVGRAISEYGVPRLTVLCVGERKYIADLEGKAIVAFRTYLPEYGYNQMIGGVHTPQTRANIKAALAKSEAFIAVRQRIGGWNKGIPHSDKARAKMSAAGKGRPKSAETRRKMSEAAYRRHRREKGETPI